MGKTIFDYASDNGKYTLFGLPATEELAGRTAALPDGSAVRFETELAVKCADDMFLAAQAGRILLVEELPDETLKALDAGDDTADAAALPEELEGWETDLGLASGYILTAKFGDGALTLRPPPEPEGRSPLTPAPPEEAKAPPAPAAPPETFRLLAAEVSEKRFLFRFPESGEILFFDGRRFLLYAILRGRIVSGFVEVPPRDRT